MGAKSKIDWCDSTWNPVTGCLHGCEYCYARKIAERFGGFDCGPVADCSATDRAEGIFTLNAPMIKRGIAAPYPFGFAPTFYHYRLDEPQKWKKGRNIFVCSMADLFGRWVPDEWIEEVLAACKKAPQHNYLFLTKNAARYTEDNYKYIEERHKNVNAWYGVSVTKQSDFNINVKRLPLYRNCFFSIEPILEEIHIDVNKITEFPRKSMWVIIGSETGNRKDKVIPKKEWIENIVDECRKADIPVFMKESLADIWGEPLIQEYPEGLRKEH